MNDGMPIGTRIARRRQALRMTQEDLARELGVSRAAVANWESGKHFPSRKLGAVEAALGITLDGPEPEADVMPEGLREAIYETIPNKERAALVEQVVEAALKGEELPVKRRARGLAPAPPPVRAPARRPARRWPG